MGELHTIMTTGSLLCLYDDRGRLVGIIPHPATREPLGKGRETVLLVRPEQPAVHRTAA